MSNRVTSIKEELGMLRNEWDKLDPTVRFLDLSSIILIILFGVGYIVVNVLDITLTVSNGAMLVFPLFLTGYVYVLRSKIVDESEDNNSAIKEFRMFVIITLALILLTFVYALILNTVL